MFCSCLTCLGSTFTLLTFLRQFSTVKLRDASEIVPKCGLFSLFDNDVVFGDSKVDSILGADLVFKICSTGVVLQ